MNLYFYRMKNLKGIFITNRYFFIPYFIFLIGGLVFLFVKGKADTFIYLNPYHRPGLDTFFSYFTNLGDGLFSVFVFLILLMMKRWSPAAQVILAYSISGLLAQLVKHLISMPRPRQFFLPGQYAYFIKGETLTGSASFPSGHSASIFALLTLMALFGKNKKGNSVWLLGAIAVGYSRIYLGNHFLLDVLTGSFIGLSGAVFVHWLFIEKFPSFPRRRPVTEF